MGGFKRVARRVFDSLAAGADPVVTAEAPYPAPTKSSWANGSSIVAVAAATAGKKGVRANTTGQLQGALHLVGQAAAKVKLFARIAIPAGVSTNTAISRIGATVFATNGGATGKGIFAGLGISASGTTKTWVICTVDQNGVVATHATLPATIGTITSASIANARPCRVEADPATKIVKLRTPDGDLTFDASAIAGLGDWFGWHIYGGAGTPADTRYPFIIGSDSLTWDDAYVPPNRRDDRSGLFPNFTVLRDFGMGSEYLFTGATPTPDTDDWLIPGSACQSIVQGPGSNKLDVTFPGGLDLTGKCLALVAKWDCPEQLQYTKTTIVNAVTFDGTPQEVTLQSDPGLTQPDVGAMGIPGVGLMMWTSRTGLVIHDARLATTFTADGYPDLNGMAVVAANTEATLHKSGIGTLSSPSIKLGASIADIANNVELRGQTSNWNGWVISTFLVKGGLDYNGGWEGRVTGSPPPINNIGAMRIAATITGLPLSDTGGTTYSGQQRGSAQPSIKWNCLAMFDKIERPSLTVTFDDCNKSDSSVIAPLFLKKRPGFPNGMRASMMSIDSNMGRDPEANSSLREYQAMSAAGFEIAMHCHWQGNHADGADKTQYDEAGYGPPLHYEAQIPGGPIADLTAQMAFFKRAFGTGPKFTWAWPHAVSPGPNITEALRNLGVVAHRSLSRGINTYNKVGSPATVPSWDMSAVTTRFVTYPPGDVIRFPGGSFDRDLVGADKRGHLATMRLLLEACQQGGGLVLTGHDQAPGSGTGASSASWNGDQWEEFLKYVSDLKTGDNTSGYNGAGAEYPNLEVLTLYELATGEKPKRALPELAGAPA